MIDYNTISIKYSDEINKKLMCNQKVPMNPQLRETIIDSTLKHIRLKNLQRISEKTKRNTICYFSPFMQSFSQNPDLSINDNDMNGFASAIANLDRNKGLDLIIHTPGGSTAATEAIVEYLKRIFNGDIRVIVPNLCMSAGTMIACSSKEILMLEQGSLGPFDPQYRGVPAQGVVDEFKEAIKDVEKNPNRALIWREIISKYAPAFLSQCSQSLKCSKQMVTKWLENMFPERGSRKQIHKIVNELCSFKKTKMHDRHYNYDKCKNLGLNVKLVDEKSPELLDAILEIYYSYLYSSYMQQNTIKYIETNIDNSFIIYGKR